MKTELFTSKRKTFFLRLCWRMLFKKVKVNPLDAGRCINCDAGNPIIECGDYYCPCGYYEQLKRK